MPYIDIKQRLGHRTLSEFVQDTRVDLEVIAMLATGHYSLDEGAKIGHGVPDSHFVDDIHKCRASLLRWLAWLEST